MSLTQNILAYIEHNAEWALLVVFVIAFLESIAIIGVLIPGWVLLVGIGTLIGADVLSFYPVVIGAYCGAVIGEYLSFLVGMYYRDNILTWSLIRKHQQIVDKSIEFFIRHGVGGVFIGRFFGPTRAVVPLIAGVSKMQHSTFVWVNLVSGLFWAPLYLIPGILIGAAISLPGDLGQQLLLVLGLIIIVAWVAMRWSRALLNHSVPMIGNLFGIIKVVSSWCALMIMLWAFANSEYFELLSEIFAVLKHKL